MSNITFSEVCKVIDLTANTMDNYMYVADFKNDVYHISKEALSRFSVPSETFSDVVESHKLFVYEPDYPAIKEELQELADSNRSTHNMQYRWTDKEGNPIWINCRGTVIREDGKPLYLIGCINEIGAKPKADNQSGMLRLGGAATLPKEIENDKFNGYIIRFGIDDLRGINARWGSATGDYVIAQTAEAILTELNENQYVYHIEGDEFIILSLKAGDYDDALSMYKKIRDNIILRIRASEYKVIYSVSAGILVSTDIEDASFEYIMKASEFALSSAKNLGKNTYARFNISEYENSLKRHKLAKELRDSVSKNFAGFDVNYQILVSKEAGIIGAETLMRYSSPDGTQISPTEFIPIMEENGLIIPAGRWILRKAAQTCIKVKKYIPDFFITVNVSYVQVSRTDLAKDVEKVLEDTGLNPGSLVIELTESGLLESNLHFANTWKKLKALGVRLALDDFGTGYSNFHYLNELRPDILKIDRGFTVSALKDEYEFALLYNMRHLATNLSLNMCVEGVETAEDLEKIDKINPEYVQGFYFGRPSKEEALLERVAQ